MRLSVDEQMVECARTLGPVIRDNAGRAEQERRLPRVVLDALAEAGLQRLFTPRSLGGLEADPVTLARVVEETAGFDSAAAWALQSGNAGAWWAARLPNEGVQEIYGGGPTVLMAAAFHPPQQAIEADGGYRVTGRGPLASCIHDAEWLFLTAMVMDGEQPRMIDGRPEMIAVILHSGEAEVLDTWHTLGMRGTDSNDVVVNDVFVPSRRSLRLVPEFEPAEGFHGPLYRYPGVGLIALFVTPIMLAMARGAITELRGLAQRKTPFGYARALGERTTVQAYLAESEGSLRAARLLFYDAVGDAWERTRAGEASTLEQKADLLLAGTYAVSRAVEVIDRMHRLAGTSGIYTRCPLERYLRDAQTLRHHGFVSANRFEAVGQVYLGQPPEFGLVAF